MGKIRPIKVYPEDEDELFLTTYMQVKKKKHYSFSSKKAIKIAQQIVEEAKKK